MKQKTLKPVLLGLVALVWGLIIYKVASGLGDDGPEPRAASAKKALDLTAAADSFILFANYPDPFIPVEEDDSTQTQAAPLSNALPGNLALTNNVAAMAPPPPVFDPSKIKYTGMIANPDRKIKIAILMIDGQEYLVKEKQQVKDYKVKSIGKEKVVVVWRGESKVVELGK